MKIINLILAATAAFSIAPRVRAFVPVITETEEGFEMNMGDYSIEDLQPVIEGGTFNAPPLAVRTLGYDPSKTWYAGERPENIIQIGDLQYYGLLNLSLQELSLLQGTMFWPANVALDEVGLIQNQSIRDLASTIPNFRNLRVRDVAPLDDLLENRFSNRRIGQILERRPRDLIVEVTEREIDEVRAEAERQITALGTELVGGIQSDLDTVEANIAGYMDDLGIDLDLQTLLDESLNLSTLEQQLESDILARQTLLQQQIDEFIASATQYDRIGINSEINRILNQYQQQFQQDIVTQISTQLNSITGNLPELNSLETEISRQISSYVSESLNELSVVARSRVQQLKQQVQTELDRVVEDNIGNVVSDLSDRLPDEIGNIVIADYDLEGYTVEDIPGLDSTDIGNFSGVMNLRVSEIPGASSLDFNRYPNLPDFGTGIARIDLVFSEAEKYAERAISGSDVAGFTNTSCDLNNSTGNGCSHIELGGPLGFNRGKQWVSGDSQRVEGGHGILKAINGGREPTGRLPFREAPFKMVLRNADEQTDTVDMRLAFRYGFVDLFGNRHYTPYGVFEIPFTTFKVRDVLFLGIP